MREMPLLRPGAAEVEVVALAQCPQGRTTKSAEWRVAWMIIYNIEGVCASVSATCPSKE
jgi:hypothetical protein